VKPFTAILFSLLLMLTPFASLQAASLCPPAKMMACCNASCHMACCAHRSSSPSTPAGPVQKTGVQYQASLLALAVVIWAQPKHHAGSISCAKVLPLTATGTPLYERNCTLLL
jgi:hypothetical protein